MALSYNRHDGSLDLKPQAKKQRAAKLLVISGVGTGLFWLFTQQPVSHRPTVALNTPETSPAPQAPQAALKPAVAPPAPAVVSQSPVTISPAPAPTRTVATPQPVPQRSVSLVTNDATVQRQLAALSQLPELPHRVQALDSLIALTRNIQTLTPRQMKDMPRLVTKMRYQGAAAVPAIRAFLQTKADFNFDKIQGSDMASQRTLRLALIDTLRQIGGKEANVALDEQLKNNNNVAELAMLKQGLAQQARRGSL
jgi:hypothetical protein